MTLDPTNPNHWNKPKENIVPENTAKNNVVPDATHASDNTLSSIFDDAENTKPDEREFLIKRAMDKLADSQSKDAVAPAEEVSQRPTTRPIPLFEEVTTANERPLERISSEQLIVRVDHLFKQLIITLGDRATKKPFIGSTGNDYSAQKIAEQILIHFSGVKKVAIITNTYNIQEIVREITTIAKELSARDLREKGIERKKETWNRLYKELKPELQRIAAIPIPIQKTN